MAVAAVWRLQRWKKKNSVAFATLGSHLALEIYNSEKEKIKGNINIITTTIRRP